MIDTWCLHEKMKGTYELNTNCVSIIGCFVCNFCDHLGVWHPERGQSHMFFRDDAKDEGEAMNIWPSTPYWCYKLDPFTNMMCSAKYSLPHLRLLHHLAKASVIALSLDANHPDDHKNHK